MRSWAANWSRKRREESRDSGEDRALLEDLGLKGPEGKRRKTQEEEDWNDDSWKDGEIASRDIDLVGRYEIEERIDRWIHEIEKDVEESLRHREQVEEELSSGEDGAWED
eukprot:3824078-Karenia_brevis.AAC.1